MRLTVNAQNLSLGYEPAAARHGPPWCASSPLWRVPGCAMAGRCMCAGYVTCLYMPACDAVTHSNMVGCKSPPSRGAVHVRNSTCSTCTYVSRCLHFAS